VGAADCAAAGEKPSRPQAHSAATFDLGFGIVVSQQKAVDILGAWRKPAPQPGIDAKKLIVRRRGVRRAFDVAPHRLFVHFVRAAMLQAAAASVS
jgi:hypothetical protein